MDAKENKNAKQDDSTSSNSNEKQFIRDPKKKTHAAITSKGSALKKYQQVIVGSESLWDTFYFEVCSWLGVIPGALGIVLRKIFWPRLFHSCGSGVLFAKGIILRHPKRVSIGNDVIISEGVILDARHDDVDFALRLEDNVILSNNIIINCKGAKISIGKHTGVGAQTTIQAIGDCDVNIGDDVIIGPHCYIVGGGSYNMDDLDTPIWKQGNKADGGCKINNNVWIGANVTVLGGNEVASDCVIAANAVVNKSTNKGDIVGGVPAKVIKNRFEQTSSH